MDSINKITIYPGLELNSVFGESRKEVRKRNKETETEIQRETKKRERVGERGQERNIRFVSPWLSLCKIALSCQCPSHKGHIISVTPLKVVFSIMRIFFLSGF